jgi:hypothetical protein
LPSSRLRLALPPPCLWLRPCLISASAPPSASASFLPPSALVRPAAVTHGALIHRCRSRFIDGHHGHPGHHGHRSARAWVDACLSVKHHKPSLAPAPTPAGQHHHPGLTRLCPDPLSATPLRYRRTLGGFPYGISQRLEHGRFAMMDAYPFGFGCCSLSVWFSFGRRLVHVWLSFGFRWSCSCLLACFCLVFWLSAVTGRDIQPP